MGLLDKFLDAIKLNDDYDDDDDFLDDDDFDEEDDFEDEKPKRRFFKKSKDDFDDFDDFEDEKPSRPAAKDNKSFKQTAASSATYNKKSSSKVTPMRKKGTSSMEVNVIRPESMEDAREIAETLMNSCTVILNLEGLDVDVAQRIIDFTCGACYSLGGSLQKIAGYIYILTPADVDISGDFQQILNGSLDITSMR